tara:strand:+ start:35694 stop:37382 length:1689 start_codon:yes stop_codon:yes gene_type:complete
MIRHRAIGFSLLRFSAVQQIVALFPDGILIFRFRKAEWKLEDCDLSDADEVRQTLNSIKSIGEKTLISYDEISSAQVGPYSWIRPPNTTNKSAGYPLVVETKGGETHSALLAPTGKNTFLSALRRVTSEGVVTETMEPLPLNHGPRWLAIWFWISVVALIGSQVLISTQGSSAVLGLTRGIAIGLVAVGAVIYYTIFVSNAVHWSRFKVFRKGLTKEKKDQSHRRPFRNRPIGVILRTLGILSLPVSFLIFGYTLVSDDFEDGITLGFVFSSLLMYFGYRIGLKIVEATNLEKDQYTLVLRSFDDDHQMPSFEPKGFGAILLGVRAPKGGLWSIISNLNPNRILRLAFSQPTDTAEEQLAFTWRKIGRLVTCGRPGERIMTGGAERFYLPDHGWQDALRELIQNAAHVIIQPGDSEGLEWEIVRVFELQDPGTVLISLATCQDQSMYDDFRIHLESHFDCELPRTIDDALFLAFGRKEDGNYEAIALPNFYRNPIQWLFRRGACDLDKVLEPYWQLRKGETPVLQTQNRKSYTALIGVACILYFAMLAVIVAAAAMVGLLIQ